MGDSLTVFTIPRAFAGDVALRQRNAVMSWLMSGYGVLLLGDDPGVVEFADEIGVDVLSDIERNEWGTPLVSDAFAKAQAVLDGELAAFVNTDVMLDESLGHAVMLAAARFERFLVVGCRHDADVEGPFDFEGDWQARLRSLADPARLHGEHGLDYFGFRAPLWGEIPPFALGRMRWDNWLLDEANGTGAETVDATLAVLAVHQAHGYEHISAKAGPDWVGQPEIAANWALAGQRIAGTNSTRWTLRGEELTAK